MNHLLEYDLHSKTISEHTSPHLLHESSLGAGMLAPALENSQLHVLAAVLRGHAIKFASTEDALEFLAHKSQVVLFGPLLFMIPHYFEALGKVLALNRISFQYVEGLSRQKALMQLDCLHHLLGL